MVERRSPAPLVDLALLRNRLLIGATVGILIGAGTINGLMFVRQPLLPGSRAARA